MLIHCDQQPQDERGQLGVNDRIRRTVTFENLKKR